MHMPCKLINLSVPSGSLNTIFYLVLVIISEDGSELGDAGRLVIVIGRNEDKWNCSVQIAI